VQTGYEEGFWGGRKARVCRTRLKKGGKWIFWRAAHDEAEQGKPVRGVSTVGRVLGAKRKEMTREGSSGGLAIVLTGGTAT